MPNLRLILPLVIREIKSTDRAPEKVTSFRNRPLLSLSAPSEALGNAGEMSHDLKRSKDQGRWRMDL